MADLFVDRLHNVTITGGVARLDFLRVREVDAKSQQISMEPAGRLTMTMDALNQMLSVLQQMQTELSRQVAAQAVQKTETVQ